MKRLHHLLIMITSALGIIDTVALLSSTFTGGSTSCGENLEIIGIPVDCGFVTQSVYSQIFGIPISLLGLIYYSSIFILLLIIKELEYKPIKRETVFIIILSLIAFSYSIYLICIQLFILNSICLYCMGSAFTSIILFFLILSPLVSYLKRKPEAS